MRTGNVGLWQKFLQIFVDKVALIRSDVAKYLYGASSILANLLVEVETSFYFVGR